MCTVLGNLETNELSDAITTLVNTCRIIQKSQVSVEEYITTFMLIKDLHCIMKYVETSII